MIDPRIIGFVVSAALVFATVAAVRWLISLPEPPIKGRNPNPMTPKPDIGPFLVPTGVPTLTPEQARELARAFNDELRMRIMPETVVLKFTPLKSYRVELDIEDEP